MSVETPGPGVYRDVPNAVYHAWDLFSNSRAAHFERSAFHYQHAFQNPTPQTDEMRLGSAVHTLALQPHLFDEEFCVWRGGAKRSNDAKAAYAQFLVDNAGKTALAVDEAEEAHIIASVVREHPLISRLLETADEIEVSCVADHPETGTPCKVRADLVSVPLRMAFDFKTTADASPAAFKRSIANFGYHRQAALYQDILQLCGYPIEHFVFGAIEKKKPYCCALYKLDNDAITRGREQLIHIMERLNSCAQTNDWPAYPEGIQDITLPAWAWTQGTI